MMPDVTPFFNSLLALPESIVLLSFALIGSVLGLAGGIVFLYHRKWSVLLEKYSVPFAAGAMITVAMIALLPEAEHMIGQNAFIVMLGAFFVAFFFEQFLFPTHHHSHNHSHGEKCVHEQSQKNVSHSDSNNEAKKVTQSATMLVILGDTVHNFIDGVAIGAAFVVNPLLGLTTAISTLLHELPHEIGDFGILLNAGWQKKHIILVNVVSALFTVVGAFGVLFVAQDLEIIGTLLAISAGIFFYLGTIDFIPHSFHTSAQNKRRSFLSLLLGVVILFTALSVMPHDHDHDHDHGHGHSHASDEKHEHEDDHNDDNHDNHHDDGDHHDDEDHHHDHHEKHHDHHDDHHDDHHHED